MTIKIVCIVHADFETPGVIEEWARKAGHSFKIYSPYKGDVLKNVDFDFFLIMGGPQSPRDLDKNPFLKDEITFIQKAIQANKRVLGFCLGAQLIGEALGAKTLQSPEKEIGVHDICLTEEGLMDLLFQGLPQVFPAIHWHNDMPGLTDTAVVLAHSQGCPRQIIRYSPKVYGFQCHLEITLEGIKTLMEAVPEDLKPSIFTQTPEGVLNHDYDSINQMMIHILDRYLSV